MSSLDDTPHPLDLVRIDDTSDSDIEFWAAALDLHPRQLRYLMSIVGTSVWAVANFVAPQGPADHTVCH